MKRISKILFLAVSAMLLVVPMLTTNLKPNQVSEFDNRNLKEFPALQINGFRSGVEGYVSDRVGFRTEMITIYQKFCDIAFHKLVHPSYVYGKGEYIMSPWDLVTYQHLDADATYIESYTDYLKSLEQFCQNMDAEFLFYLCPNKETIYPEYFPDGYNIKDQPNRSELIIQQLEKKEVPYLSPKELFLSLKNEYQLYNVKYDAGHWNATGTFYGQQQIIHYLNERFPEMGELKWEEFEVSQTQMQSLPMSHFEIDEMVPCHTLIHTDAVRDREIFDQITLIVPNYYRFYYKNETALQNGAPKVLIFGDSYFEASDKYYVNHCSELMLLHSLNMPNIEYYISLFQPDIVIYEAVERVLQLSDWDGYKAEKRFYTLDGLQNNAAETGAPFAEKILLDVDIADLQLQAQDQRIVSISGSLSESATGDPSDILTLAAVLNGREYYPIFDKGTLSYQFAFRAEDVLESSEIAFYVLRGETHK